MNEYHSEYDHATGLFTGRTLCMPAEYLAGNTAPGCALIAGQHDPAQARVVLRHDDFGDALPVVERYKPPAPAGDEWRAWAWDADAWRWLSTPTTAALARTARTRRAALLAACDWIVARSAEWGEPVPEAWANYRQALRNVPDQPGFPADINWPQEPA